MDTSQSILESKYVKMESEIFKSKAEEIRQKNSRNDDQEAQYTKVG